MIEGKEMLGYSSVSFELISPVVLWELPLEANDLSRELNGLEKPKGADLSTDKAPKEKYLHIGPEAKLRFEQVEFLYELSGKEPITGALFPQTPIDELLNPGESE